MALSTNPTKTRTIEAAYVRETSKRYDLFAAFTDKTVRATQRLNNFKANRQQFLINQFSIDPDAFEALMRLLRVGAYDFIVGTTDPENANSSAVIHQTTRWQNRYISPSYLRGVETGQAQLRSFGVDVGLTVPEIRALYDVATDEEVARVLVGLNSLHNTSIDSLQSNAMAGLVQSVETMLGQIRSKIEEENTASPISKVLTDLRKVVSKNESTGKQVASTSTIQSFQNGQITNAAITEERLKAAGTPTEIKLRWLTRQDNLVRHLHANWHGVVMTKIEASQNINVSKWNCRCGFAQEPPAAYNNPKRNAKFAKEREKLLAMGGGGSAPPAAPAPKPKPKPTPKPKPKLPKGVRPKGYASAGAIEKEWVDNSLVNQGYNKVLPTVGVPSNVGNIKKGAYYQGDKINMGTHLPNTLAGQAVYRHEYGHYVDDKNGWFSQQSEFNEALRLDNQAVNAHTTALGKAYRLEKAGNTNKRGAGYVKTAFASNARKTFDGIDASTPSELRAWGKANIPANTMARELFDLVDLDAHSTQLGVQRTKIYLAGLKEAARMDDNPVLLGQVMWEYNGGALLKTTNREAGQLADLLNATNRDYGGGHSAKYYKDRYRAENAEAFAQLFSIHGNAVAPVFKRLADLLAGNQNKIVKGFL